MSQGNDLLAQIEQDNPKLGIFLRQYLIPSIQKTADNAAVSSQSYIKAPPPPESVSVTTAGEMMQVVVNHSAPIQKGIQYITHIATNPQFSGAMILDHGSSRAPAPIFLPTKDGSGNTHQYYIATVAQYPGSPPSPPRFYGGNQATPVTMSGTTQFDLQAGTGSGTAMNGGEPLVGLGRSQVRLAQGPKRQV
jgi:hypothetical protein